VSYAFRRTTPADLPLLRRWLGTPEVRRWWDDPDDLSEFEEAFADRAVAMWIVSHEGRPFAYIQDYDPHAWPAHHFGYLPHGSRGIDQFIGEPEMIGRGHGSAFVGAHVDRLFDRGAPAVGTDPHPDNARAIRAYAKAGFVAGATCDTEWGLSVLMTRGNLDPVVNQL
jgi:aminoglycoside 6'-N-acetyltransferase